VSTGVSAHLEQEHSVRIPPGGKGICPFCRHETFSVRKCDSVGKCWHPTCGRFITSGSLQKSYQGSLYEILDQIKQDCHAELTRQKDDSAGWAWQYLTNKRGIDLRVLFDLPEIGVVPRGYDVDKVFVPHLEKIAERRKELETKIEDSLKRRLEAKEQRKKDHAEGRQKSAPTAKGKTDQEKWWEKELAGLDKQLKFLEEQRHALREQLTKAAGWIAFFHTDHSHRVRSIKFRKYEGKHFQSFAPFKGRKGLFGHGLFAPFQGEERKSCNRLMLVEGEINLLQIHSLALRTAAEEGDSGKTSPKYANWVASVGSASSVDTDTIAALLKTPGAVKPLVVIQDNDEAGEAMTKRLSRCFTVDLVLPPGRDQDIDDFIRGFGADHHGAWAALVELIQKRQTVCRPWDALAQDVFMTRQNQGEGDTRREFEINAQVRDIVLTDLNERGQFYHSHHQGYFFLCEEKNLIPLDDRDSQLSCLLNRYGLNPVEKTCEYVKKALHIEALTNGKETKVHRLTWYNAQTHTLYLFNHASGVYLITADGIELADNGTDGVLFLSDPRNEPFVLVPDENLGDLFYEHVTAEINFDTDGQLPLGEQQLLFDHWFYSIFFGSIMPTRPLLAFIGPKGSGKSYTLRRVGMLLNGGNFQVENLPASEGDFDAITTNSYFAAFDNADSRVKWLPDRLAICATGGTVSKRILYTTNSLTTFPIDCFLGITSRTPQFNRDDVADRTLINRVKRFEEGKYRGEHELKAAILKDRNRILTAVVRRLRECIAALKQTEGKSYRTSFRMADFATFCLRLAETKGEQEKLQAIFAKMQDEQTSFSLEGDTLVDLLGFWLDVREEKMESGRVKKEYVNQGRQVTAATLYNELSALAEARKMRFAYQSGRSLAQRLGHIETNLGRLFDMAITPDPTKKQKVYQFWSKLEDEAPESESPGIGKNDDSGAANHYEEVA
jgi:hypothetical protein